MLMVRPKLSDEKADMVTLDILAEQAKLVPPGEEAVEGAVPRDVPGLVSHKFKLTAEVKLGGSLLVAESPAGKKQLRDAVKQQFLLIVTPQRAVRAGRGRLCRSDRGGQGRSPPQSDGSIARSRHGRRARARHGSRRVAQGRTRRPPKETAELKRQIDALQQELNKLRSLTEPKPRQFPLKHRKPQDVAEEVDDAVVRLSDAKDRFKITVRTRAQFAHHSDRGQVCQRNRARDPGPGSAGPAEGSQPEVGRVQPGGAKGARSPPQGAGGRERPEAAAGRGAGPRARGDGAARSWTWSRRSWRCKAANE